MNYTFQANYELENEDLLNIKTDMTEAILEYLRNVFGIQFFHLSDDTLTEIAKKALEVQ